MVHNYTIPPFKTLDKTYIKQICEQLGGELSTVQFVPEDNGIIEGHFTVSLNMKDIEQITSFKFVYQTKPEFSEGDMTLEFVCVVAIHPRTKIHFISCKDGKEQWVIDHADSNFKPDMPLLIFFENHKGFEFDYALEASDREDMQDVTFFAFEYIEELTTIRLEEMGLSPN